MNENKKHIPSKRLKQWHRNAMSVDGVQYVSLKEFARSLLGNAATPTTAQAWLDGKGVRA